MYKAVLRIKGAEVYVQFCPMTVFPVSGDALCKVTIGRFLEGIDILEITSYDSLILQKKVAYLCGCFSQWKLRY
jgi:hypothetical protein